MTFDTNNSNGPSEKHADKLTNNTRRRFLTGSAGAVGGLAVGGAFTSPAFAHDDEDKGENGEADPEPGQTPPAEAVPNEFEDDVDILNYARLLEFLEAKFYEEGLQNISEDEFRNAGALSSFGDAILNNLYSDLEVIRDHERDHAETLGAVITDLGGQPIEEPEVDFGQAVQNPAAFVATGAALEDTGVSAYAGAAPHIENEAVVVGALSIHSVEARHASFLRKLNGEIGYPVPYDQPRSRSEVEAIASDFLVGGMDETTNGDY